MNANRPLRVVVDTNLVVSAFMFRRGTPDQLVQRLHAEAFTTVISTELMDEYRDVLSRPALIDRYGLNRQEIASFFTFWILTQST